MVEQSPKNLKDNNKKRIVLITQDDPFYLGKHLDYLLNGLPKNTEVVMCVLLSVSPFGKRQSLIEKARHTISVFGLLFFLRYAVRFVMAKIDTKSRVTTVMNKHEVPIVVLANSINHNKSLAKIQACKPDILLSVAGNEIFKKPLIKMAPLGCLNLHSALLPKYRGLMPSFWVLKNKEKETGVSIFFVDEGIDSGPILVQKRLAIEDMTLEQLIETSKKLGMDAIVESIEKICSGDISCQENDGNKSTYFGFPTTDDVKQFRKNGGRFY